MFISGFTNRITISIPLKLTWSAFTVYKHLSEKREDIKSVNKALISAFSADAFQAYEKIVTCRFLLDDAADVYFADLESLVGRFGGVPEQDCLAGARMEFLTLEGALERTRAVISEE